MIEKLKSYFKRPNPLEVVAHELADAELALLHSLTARDYANAIVDYHTIRIARLKKTLTTFSRNEKV